MRAIHITSTGGPEVLTLSDIERPSPSDGEMLVQVAAAGVNFIDTYQRGGLYPMDMPFTPGLECAGTVVEVGAGVTEFAVGDRVAASEGGGSYAEFRIVSERVAIPVPDDVTLETAAAVLLQGMTAHYLAHDTYPLGPGDQCLIHAAAGGTGRLLVQMAKNAGATVWGTVGNEEKAELARSAGADHTILYREVDFADEIRRISGVEKPLDVVYDGVGAAVFHDSLGLLRLRGLMATFGNASGPVAPVSPLALSAGGSLFLTRPTLFHYVSTREELLARAGAVLGMVADGSIEVRIDTMYGLDDADEAHRHLEERRSTGKILLTP
jgi:NADPH2:quinone reductase